MWEVTQTGKRFFIERKRKSDITGKMIREIHEDPYHKQPIGFYRKSDAQSVCDMLNTTT